MKYRFLGDTGVQVSALCMGTMTFGREADKQTAAAIFKRCRDAGVNFFDCADVYNKGVSEEMLGEIITGCRDELIITTIPILLGGGSPLYGNIEKELKFELIGSRVFADKVVQSHYSRKR